MCVNRLSSLEELVPGGSCPHESEDTPESGHGHSGAWASGSGVSAGSASARPLGGARRSEWGTDCAAQPAGEHLSPGTLPSPAASESVYRYREDRYRTVQVGHRGPTNSLVIGGA